MKQVLIIAATAVALTGCGHTGCLTAPPPPGSGVHVASVEPNGKVCFRPLSINKPSTSFLSTGIMSEGHMEAPPPGQAWWD